MTAPRNTQLANVAAGNGVALAPQKADPAVSMVRMMMAQVERALPRHLGQERFGRLLLTQLRLVPSLLECNQASLMAALMQLAQLGLEPDANLGLVYLIPYGKEAKLIIGYRGLIELARRSGLVRHVHADVAYEHDQFAITLGLHRDVQHSPALGDRGDPIAAYAVAVLADGEQVFDWMTWAEITKIRDASKASKSGPWVSHLTEMARKTVVRRLCKRLPLSPELAAAISVDERVAKGTAPGMPGEQPVALFDDSDVIDAQVVPASAGQTYTRAPSTPVEPAPPAEEEPRPAALQEPPPEVLVAVQRLSREVCDDLARQYNGGELPHYVLDRVAVVAKGVHFKLGPRAVAYLTSLAPEGAA